MVLSIIIVSYNVRELVEQCLHSVNKAIAYSGKEAEIVVVDNNSPDKSIDYLSPNFPEIKFIANNVNLGFAKACNQGINVSSGKYVLFLNPDTVVPENCFQQCIAFFQQHVDAGAIGVKMTDENGVFLKESKRGFPSPATSFYKLFGLANLFPGSKHFAKYYLVHLNENETHEVDVLAGAFMMMPREVLDKAGYFDESFFMYGEDIDLSYRVKQAGYKNYYLGEISITHLKGRSTPKNDAGNIRTFYKAMKIFASKYYPEKKNSFSMTLIRTGIEIRMALALVAAFIKRIFH